MTPKQRGVAKATKRKAEGAIVCIRVWIPLGLKAEIHEVVAEDDSHNLYRLHILSANVEP